MPTTSRGLIYPASTEHTRIWEHLQNLATSADTAIGTVASAINDHGSSGYIKIGSVLVQWGRVAITGTGATTASGVVTYPLAFSASPQVVATVLAGSLYFANSSTPATTTCTITIRDRNDTVISGTINASWLAIGLA